MKNTIDAYIEFENVLLNIEQESIDGLVAYAKKYNIHQDSTNKFYLDNVKRIKERLVLANIDPATVRSE
jgi:hypothetical protein